MSPLPPRSAIPSDLPYEPAALSSEEARQAISDAAHQILNSTGTVTRAADCTFIQSKLIEHIVRRDETADSSISQDLVDLVIKMESAAKGVFGTGAESDQSSQMLAHSKIIAARAKAILNHPDQWKTGYNNYQYGKILEEIQAANKINHKSPEMSTMQAHLRAVREAKNTLTQASYKEHGYGFEEIETLNLSTQDKEHYRDIVNNTHALFTQADNWHIPKAGEKSTNQKLLVKIIRRKNRLLSHIGRKRDPASLKFIEQLRQLPLSCVRSKTMGRSTPPPHRPDSPRTPPARLRFEPVSDPRPHHPTASVASTLAPPPGFSTTSKHEPSSFQDSGAVVAPPHSHSKRPVSAPKMTQQALQPPPSPMHPSDARLGSAARAQTTASSAKLVKRGQRPKRARQTSIDPDLSEAQRLMKKYPSIIHPRRCSESNPQAESAQLKTSAKAYESVLSYLLHSDEQDSRYKTACDRLDQDNRIRTEMLELETIYQYCSSGNLETVSNGELQYILTYLKGHSYEPTSVEDLLSAIEEIHRRLSGMQRAPYEISQDSATVRDHKQMLALHRNLLKTTHTNEELLESLPGEIERLNQEAGLLDIQYQKLTEQQYKLHNARITRYQADLPPSANERASYASEAYNCLSKDHSPSPPPKGRMPNLGVTCYFNAAFRQIVCDSSLRNLFFSEHHPLMPTGYPLNDDRETIEHFQKRIKFQRLGKALILKMHGFSASECNPSKEECKEFMMLLHEIKPSWPEKGVEPMARQADENVALHAILEAVGSDQDLFSEIQSKPELSKSTLTQHSRSIKFTKTDGRSPLMADQCHVDTEGELALKLSAVPSTGLTTVADYLDQQFTETIHNPEAAGGDGTGKYIQHTTLHNLKSTLLVPIERATLDDCGTRSKDNRRIVIGETLDLRKHLAPGTDAEEGLYEVSTISVHLGDSYASGHYISVERYIIDSEETRFRVISDDKIWEEDLDSLEAVDTWMKCCKAYQSPGTFPYIEKGTSHKASPDKWYVIDPRGDKSKTFDTKEAAEAYHQELFKLNGRQYGKGLFDNATGIVYHQIKRPDAVE